jgi:hypothetical protein
MAALATFLRDTEWLYLLHATAPHGAKTITRDSTTQFTVASVDVTSLFPAGRRIRVLDGVSSPTDVWVNTSTFTAGNTVVTVIGADLPVTILTPDGVAIHAATTLASLAWSSIGTTAARPTTVPEGTLYFDTDLDQLFLYWNAAWLLIADLAGQLTKQKLTLENEGATPDRIAEIEELADRFRIRHSADDGSTWIVQLELREDGKLYFGDPASTLLEVASAGAPNVTEFGKDSDSNISIANSSTPTLIPELSDLTFPKIDGVTRYRVHGFFYIDRATGGDLGELEMRTHVGAWAGSGTLQGETDLLNLNSTGVRVVPFQCIAEPGGSEDLFSFMMTRTSGSGPQVHVVYGDPDWDSQGFNGFNEQPSGTADLRSHVFIEPLL